MLMNLLSGRVALHFVGGWGWAGGVVALALTIHDHSSSAELFFIEEALSARARVCVCARWWGEWMGGWRS